MSNPFKNWTQADVERFNAKRVPLVIGDITLGEGVLDEIPLHNEILKECDRRGWIAFHGSTAHRTKRKIGEPDFIIVADTGRVFFIEAKAKGGKLTKEQDGVLHWLIKLGARAGVVRSMAEFILLVSCP